MYSRKRVLFVTWDGPQTNYLENLFFPIFSQLKEWDFHVLQFSWAKQDKPQELMHLARTLGIHYTHIPSQRWPHPLVGTVFTLRKGIQKLKAYIDRHRIDILMPRSTFPAIMAQAIKRKQPQLKVVFDADGLPLEERVDFGGLNPQGLQYQYLKQKERQMLQLADRVLVRSNHAIVHHLQRIGEQHKGKFYRVSNGRNEQFFNLNSELREDCRKKLGLGDKDLLVVYTGSLGPQYGVDTMMQVFSAIRQQCLHSKFLVLTGNPAYLNDRLPQSLLAHVKVVSGPYNQIPVWLNAADLAFAFRQPLPSMKAVAPIKLGEYLMMGLPTIASKGIGDAEGLLQGKTFVHLFDHQQPDNIKIAAAWAMSRGAIDKTSIRQFALQHFSLNKSKEDYQTALKGLFRTDEA